MPAYRYRSSTDTASVEFSFHWATFAIVLGGLVFAPIGCIALLILHVMKLRSLSTNSWMAVLQDDKYFRDATVLTGLRWRFSLSMLLHFIMVAYLAVSNTTIESKSHPVQFTLYPLLIILSTLHVLVSVLLAAVCSVHTVGLRATNHMMKEQHLSLLATIPVLVNIPSSPKSIDMPCNNMDDQFVSMKEKSGHESQPRDEFARSWSNARICYEWLERHAFFETLHKISGSSRLQWWQVALLSFVVFTRSFGFIWLLSSYSMAHDSQLAWSSIIITTIGSLTTLYWVTVAAHFVIGLTLYYCMAPQIAEFDEDRVRWEMFSQLAVSTSQRLLRLDRASHVHAWLSIRTFIKYFKGRYDFLRLQSSCTLLIVVITGCGFAFAAFAGLAGRDVLAVHYRDVLFVLLELVYLFLTLLTLVGIGNSIATLRAAHPAYLAASLVDLCLQRASLFSTVGTGVPLILAKERPMPHAECETDLHSCTCKARSQQTRDIETPSEYSPDEKCAYNVDDEDTHLLMAIESLRAVLALLQTDCDSDNAPQIFGFSLESAQISSLLGYFLTALVFVFNQIGFDAPDLVAQYIG